MCGIIGYVGNQSAVEILKDALTRLEYRGYDSPVLRPRITAAFTSVKTRARLPMSSPAAILKICRAIPVSAMSAGLLTARLRRQTPTPIATRLLKSP